MDFEFSNKFFNYVSLVINVLFILMAAYTLWRIENSTEQSAKHLINAAKMTQDALKAFKDWGNELTVKVVHENRPDAGDEDKLGGKVKSTPHEAQMLLAEMQKMAISIEEMDTQRLQAMMSELDSVISGMEMKEPLGAQNQTELNRLRGQRERLSLEVEQLQVRLDESARTIADLRRENRASFTAGSSLDLLKQVNERLFAELKTMRDRMLTAEERAAQLTAELNLVGPATGEVTVLETKEAGKPGDVITPFNSKNDTKALQKRILELEADRANLLEQVEESTQALSRSLREKAMIEDRFLKLDELAG